MDGVGQAVAPADNARAERRRVPPASATHRTRFLTAGQALAVATGFAIPISTSLTAGLDILLLGCWMFSGKCRETAAAVRHQSVVCLAVLMFALYGLTLLYTSAPMPHAVDFLLKYRKLLFIPILLVFFTERTVRERGLWAFQAAMLLTLGASYLMWFSVFDTSHGSPQDCAVFKNHIAQNVLMAFFAYLVAARVLGLWSASNTPGREPAGGAAENRIPAARETWGNMASLASRRWWADVLLLGLIIWNIVGMVRGRTGYLVLAALIAVLAAQRFRWRGLLYGPLLILIGAGAAYHGSQNFQDRIDRVFVQVASFEGEQTSAGWRLTQYAVCSQIAYEHPVWGTGIGSVEAEYAALVGDRGWKIAAHPENEFLLTLNQGGMIGLSVFLLFLLAQARESFRLQGRWGHLLLAAFVMLCTGSLVNSLLLNTTEGHFYVYVVALCLARRPQRTTFSRVA